MSREAANRNIKPFDPVKVLEHVKREEVEFSGGFLKADVRLWFPGLINHWSALFLELGIEVTDIICTPGVGEPEGQGQEVIRFHIGEGTVSVVASQANLAFWCGLVSPVLSGEAKKSFISYFGMRLAGSLAASFTSQDEFAIKTVIDNERIIPRAELMLQFQLNSKLCQLSFLLDQEAVRAVDSRWKKHLRSSTKSFSPHGAIIDVLLARLSVASDSLSSYLEKGNFIDLESGSLSEVLINSGRDNWKTGSLLWNDAGEVVIQVGNNTRLTTPPNYLQLEVVIARQTLDAEEFMELSQPGSFIKLPDAGAAVILAVEGEQVGEGRLFTSGQGYVVQVI